MNRLEQQAELLNDLVLINNDRMEGYRKAQEELKPEDNDLAVLFQDRIEQSRMFHTELVGEVARLGEQIATGTKTSGKIYRAWMDVNAFFGGSDRKVILDNCEVGEGAALRAYDSALEADYLAPDQAAMVLRHHAEIKASHNRIKSMRDAL
ncbi:MAG: PA2169 family four-helix-bundle protein [Bacteroidales bacterium]|nr:PA2169 family four-helix-bundle protein [Bacteroidales bacterium]